MATRSTRLTAQLIVLLPTLAVSFGLAALKVPLLPRVVAGVGFGMILIFCVTIWQRRRS